MVKMTPKQKLFCKEYLIDKNATQAAIRAGYSVKTSTEMGYENLRKPHVKEYLDNEFKKQANRIEITADRVLQELGKLAFSNVESLISFHNEQAFIDLTALTKDQWAAISSVSTDTHTFKMGGCEDADKEVVKTKVTLWDKKGSLDMLMKHLNQYKDDNTKSLEVTVMNDVEVDGKPVKLTVGIDPDDESEDGE